MNRRLLLALCLVSSVLVAGCVPRGDAVRIEFDGTINRTSAGFHMQGVVDTSGGIPDRDIYRDLSVNLYSKNGTLLYQESIGDLEADSPGLDVSISTDIHPKYVIISSKDFYRERMAVEYYEWRGDEYVIQYANARSDLPVTETRTSAGQ